jgi:hypothetical protein
LQERRKCPPEGQGRPDRIGVYKETSSFPGLRGGRADSPTGERTRTSHLSNHVVTQPLLRWLGGWMSCMRIKQPTACYPNRQLASAARRMNSSLYIKGGSERKGMPKRIATRLRGKTAIYLQGTSRGLRRVTPTPLADPHVIDLPPLLSVRTSKRDIMIF